MEGHKNQQIIEELKKNAIFSAEQKKTEDKKQQLMENHANRKIAATVKKKVPVRGLPPISQKDIRILQPMENLQEDNLKKKDKKKLTEKRREEYDKKGKDMKLLSPEDVHGCIYFKSKIGREDFKERHREYLTGEEQLEEITVDYVAQRILESNYANFENADLTIRNVAATMAFKKFMETYNPRADMNPEELCQRIKATGEGVSALLNPALRLGLSLAVKSDDNIVDSKMKNFLQRLDEAMSTEVMLETIAHVPEEDEVAALIREKNPGISESELEDKKREMIEANDAQQIQIAKKMLLMQLSRFDKINDDESSEPWNKTMAVAVSHCSRVMLTFSNVQKNSEGNTQKDHDDLYKVIHETREGNLAKDNPRTASTHNLIMRKVGKAGPVRTTEKKWYTGNFLKQRGMNCAIGGLGQKGIGGQRLSNDGSCGHFYSMFKKAEEGYHGAMLMGLESDASGMVNQMGHKHNWKAKGEHASSLGGQRTDEVGRKKGGRQCDLTHLSARQITEALQNLETQMREYQDKVRRGEPGTGEFKAFLNKLVGTKFNPLES